MLQESQNTNKYASATTVKVDLNQLDNHLILKISDDGVGLWKIPKKELDYKTLSTEQMSAVE
jgi:signal transduction histidine kinase